MSGDERTAPTLHPSPPLPFSSYFFFLPSVLLPPRASRGSSVDRFFFCGGRIPSLQRDSSSKNVYPNERKNNPLLEKPNLYFNYSWCYYYYCCCYCYNWILSSTFQLLLLPPPSHRVALGTMRQNYCTISFWCNVNVYRKTTASVFERELVCQREGLQFSCRPPHIQ